MHTHTHTSPCTTDIRVNWFLESKKRKRTTIEIFGASFVEARLEDVEGIKQSSVSVCIPVLDLSSFGYSVKDWQVVASIRSENRKVRIVVPSTGLQQTF